MFPLDAISARTPRIARVARFGLDLMAVLQPPSGQRAGGFRLWPVDPEGNGRPIEPLARLFIGSAEPSELPQAALADHMLVAWPEGGFFATDQVVLRALDCAAARWSASLEVTHSDNDDGIPAPRDLFLVLGISSDGQLPTALILRFATRHRDVQGAEIVIEPSAHPEMRITFAA